MDGLAAASPDGPDGPDYISVSLVTVETHEKDSKRRVILSLVIAARHANGRDFFVNMLSPRRRQLRQITVGEVFIYCHRHDFWDRLIAHAKNSVKLI